MPVKTPGPSREWKAKHRGEQQERRKLAAARRLEEALDRDNAVIEAQQAEICRRVGCGQSMLSILSEGDRTLPKYDTALKWLAEFPTFAEAYKQAQRARADVLFEEALVVADDSRNDWMRRNDPNNPGWVLNLENINRSKLRVETRKWAASKLAASKYGEKLSVEGSSDKPLVVAVTHKIIQVVRQETLPEQAEKTIEHDDPDL